MKLRIEIDPQAHSFAVDDIPLPPTRAYDQLLALYRKGFVQTLRTPEGQQRYAFSPGILDSLYREESGFWGGRSGNRIPF